LDNDLALLSETHLKSGGRFCTPQITKLIGKIVMMWGEKGAVILIKKDVRHSSLEYFEVQSVESTDILTKLGYSGSVNILSTYESPNKNLDV
jgi:hypothetical protein